MGRSVGRWVQVYSVFTSTCAFGSSYRFINKRRWGRRTLLCARVLICYYFLFCECVSIRPSVGLCLMRECIAIHWLFVIYSLDSHTHSPCAWIVHVWNANDSQVSTLNPQFHFITNSMTYSNASWCCSHCIACVQRIRIHRKCNSECPSLCRMMPICV